MTISDDDKKMIYVIILVFASLFIIYFFVSSPSDEVASDDNDDNDLDNDTPQTPEVMTLYVNNECNFEIRVWIYIDGFLQDSFYVGDGFWSSTTSRQYDLSGSHTFSVESSASFYSHSIPGTYSNGDTLSLTVHQDGGVTYYQY